TCRREHLAAEDAFRARLREREREAEETLQLLRQEKRTTDDQAHLLRAAARQEAEANRAIQKLADKVEEASREIQQLRRDKERASELLAHAQEQATRDDEECRQARTLLQQLRGDFQTFRETCVSRDRFEGVQKEREKLLKQLEKAAESDGRGVETLQALQETREKEKKLAEALKEATLTLSVKEKMLKTQEEHIDALRSQVRTKEEAVQDLAARLKRKDKETDKKLHEFAERANEWRSKYEAEVGPVREALAERAKENEDLTEAHRELQKKFLSQQKALEYAQEELRALAVTVGEQQEREREELRRVLEREHEEEKRSLFAKLETTQACMQRLREEVREREREGEKMREKLLETKKKKKERDMEMRVLLELEETKKAQAAETVKQMTGLLRQLESECSTTRVSKGTERSQFTV
ncbi:putative trichohyalin, partial [Toxoplasma gondii TgCatPRC2]